MANKKLSENITDNEKEEITKLVNILTNLINEERFSDAETTSNTLLKLLK